MEPDSYPIPGDILNSNDFFGLSYEQLLVIGSAPIIVMMFSIIIGVIPLWVSIALGVTTIVSVGVVVGRAPEGQDPFSWAAAALKRRLAATRYTLRPVSNARAPIEIQDTIHTSRNPGTLSTPVAQHLGLDSEEDTATQSEPPRSNSEPTTE